MKLNHGNTSVHFCLSCAALSHAGKPFADMSTCVDGVIGCMRDRKSLNGSSSAFCSVTVSLYEQLPVSSCVAINHIVANMLLAFHKLLCKQTLCSTCVHMFIF